MTIAHIIGAVERKAEVNHSLPLGSSLFLSYFAPELSRHRHVGAHNLRNAVACDYFKRISDQKKIPSNILFANNKHLLDLFTYAANRRNGNSLSKRKKNISISNIESHIAGSQYSSMINSTMARSLIKNASDIHDLKAILMIDAFIDNIDKDTIEDVIASNICPEESMIALLKKRAEKVSISLERVKWVTDDSAKKEVVMETTESTSLGENYNRMMSAKTSISNITSKVLVNEIKDFIERQQELCASYELLNPAEKVLEAAYRIINFHDPRTEQYRERLYKDQKNSCTDLQSALENTRQYISKLRTFIRTVNDYLIASPYDSKVGMMHNKMKREIAYFKEHFHDFSRCDVSKSFESERNSTEFDVCFTIDAAYQTVRSLQKEIEYIKPFFLSKNIPNMTEKKLSKHIDAMYEKVVV